MTSILSTRPIYQGWLNLLLVAMRAPDGETFERHVVEMNRAVAVLPYDPDRRVALVVSMPRTPVMLAGLRTATSLSIGTATMAAFIGAGGYGERIVTGLALNDQALLLAGALPAAALALALEATFGAMNWWLARRRRG